jgi:carboxyl-terminal processing protease
MPHVAIPKSRIEGVENKPRMPPAYTRSFAQAALLGSIIGPQYWAAIVAALGADDYRRPMRRGVGQVRGAPAMLWRHSALLVLLAGGLAVGACRTSAQTRDQAGAESGAQAGTESGTRSGASELDAGMPPSDDGGAGEVTFPLPTGAAPGMTCSALRVVVAQVRKSLPYAPEPVDAKGFARELTSWLDPYGYLAFERDSPVQDIALRAAPALLRELERPAPSPCPNVRAIASALHAWSTQLRAQWTAYSTMTDSGAGSGEDPATTPIPESGPILQRVALLAARSHALDAALRPYAEATRTRLFPELALEAWEQVVLASALRSWVPLLDAHSNWAPLDENATVYDVDLDDLAEDRLFTKATGTLVGARIDDGALAPLQKDDIILEVQHTPIGGFSPEQLAQVAVSALARRDAGPAPADVTVLRGGTVLRLVVRPHEAPPAADAPPRTVAETWVEAPEGRVAVWSIHDIHDALGDDVRKAIASAKAARDTLGIAIDLRGNGGGSMDGAIDALGFFLPGLPMFPLRAAHGESLAPDVAPMPPADATWPGPVAVLVDRETASAAEMLAGAVASYGRGPVVGTKTFGKGCVQEYLDDEARTGVLRVTTLLYALPNGAPVQRVGITPSLAYPFTVNSTESEAKTGHVAPSWTGPDVRPLPRMDTRGTTWPKFTPRGCKDAELCGALAVLGRGHRIGKAR